MSLYSFIEDANNTINDSYLSAAVVAKDNVILNLVAQVVIFGNIDVLNNLNTGLLRGLGFNEFRKFVPAKYSAKSDTWELNKEDAKALREELMIAANNADDFVSMAESVMEFVQAARDDAEQKEKAETTLQAEARKKKADDREEEAKKGSNKVEALGKALKKEVERGGDAIDPAAVLSEMMKKLDKAATLSAMQAILSSNGFTVTANAE